MSRPDRRAAPVALPKPGFGKEGGGFGRFRKTPKNPSGSKTCRGFGSFGSFGMRDCDESAPERDLERAARALAVLEPDPAVREEGAVAATDPLERADPVEPLLELLEAGELEAAADTLATTARTWLDRTTWRELADLALADPDRCRAALEAVFARDPAALDRVLDGLEREAAHSRSAPAVPAVTSGHTGHDRARADSGLAVPVVPAVPVEPLEVEPTMERAA